MKNLLAAILIFATASISFGQTRSILTDISNVVVQPTNTITFGELDFKAPIKLQTRRNLGLGESYSFGGSNVLSLEQLRLGQTASQLTASNATIYFWNAGNRAVGIDQTNVILLRQGGALSFDPVNTTGAAITRTNLGGTVVGQALFTTANEAAARSTLQLASYVTNPVVPLTNGGTGATNAAGARTALELASYVTNPIVPLTNGGTGASDAATARTNLGMPWVGLTNSTPAGFRSSLALASYVTNPIVPLTNGGTGASTIGQARTNLGATAVGDAVFVAVDAAAARSAIGAIASTNNITGTASNVTGVVAITNGGTGTNTAAGARTNLQIGGGINSTITFLAGAQTNTVTITNGIITSWTQSP